MAQGEPRPAEPAEGDKQQNPDEKLSRRERLRRWRRQHPRGAWAVLIGVLLLVALAVGLWIYLHSYEDTDDAQVDGHISEVSSRINGQVQQVFVEENQPVKKGQLLVELDPRDYQVEVDRRQAELAQAEAQVNAEDPRLAITRVTQQTQVSTTSQDVATAQAQLAAAERDADAARARVKETEANAIRAKADVDRYKYLLEQRAVPPQQYDDKLANARATAAEVQSAREQVRAAEKVVAQRREQVRIAELRQAQARQNAPKEVSAQRSSISVREAAVQIAQAQLERARLNLEYTRILAPFDGVVGRRPVEPGQAVTPGEQLLGVVDLNDLWVTANFKETQLEHLHPGQKVKIKVDALDQKFSGYVESIAGASGARYSLLPPENATGNYVKVVQRIPVRIRFDKDQKGLERLRPGMSVEPKVYLR